MVARAVLELFMLQRLHAQLITLYLEATSMDCFAADLVGVCMILVGVLTRATLRHPLFLLCDAHADLPFSLAARRHRNSLPCVADCRAVSNIQPVPVWPVLPKQ